jgi:predicted  nucleic acid-binding Zn-ribbon protein
MKSEKTIQSMEKELRSLRSQLSAAKKKAAMADCAERDAGFNRERADELEHRLEDVKEENRKLQETLREKQKVIDQYVESYRILSEQATELRRELAREKCIVDKLVGRVH